MYWPMKRARTGSPVAVTTTRTLCWLLLIAGLFMALAPAARAQNLDDDPTVPPPSRGDEPDPVAGTTPPVIDLWISFFINEAKVRYVHVFGREVTAADGSTIMRVCERHWARTRSRLQSKIFDSFTNVMIDMRPADLHVLRMDITTTEQDRVSRTTIEPGKTAGDFVITTELVGEKTVRNFHTDQVMIGSHELYMQRLFDAGKLKAGFADTFYELEMGGPSAQEKHFKVTKVEPGTGMISVAFDDVLWTIGPDGKLVKGTYGDTEVKTETKEAATRWGTLFAAYDAMNLDVYIPDVPAIRGVICEVTVQGDPRGDVFQSSDYHEVTSIKKNGKDVVYRLIMQRYEQKPADPVAFPLELTAEQKTALKTYLEATPLIQSEAEEIKRQARSIVRGTTDAYEAVSRLMHWIHGNLSQQYTDIGSLTALETLRQRKGDCAEHAVLFAAFARSLGIPTRQCSGYVFWGSHGGSHAWCQVKLGDTWVHVDCIGGIMKTAPQYIQFFSEPADGGDIERDREIGKRRSVLSRCPSNLRVVGFVRNGKEVVLTDAARRGSYIDGNTYSHPFAGLTVSKPEAWDWITWGYRQSTYAVMSHDAYTVHVELTSSTPDRARSNLETNYRNVARRENGGAEAEVSEGAARTIGGLEATHLIVRSATRHIELFVAPRKDGAGALVIQVITDIEKLADGDADAPRVPADLDTILSSIVAD